MMVRGKVVGIGRWSESGGVRPHLFFLDCGDRNSRNNPIVVSVWYHKQSLEPYRIYRFGRLAHKSREDIPPKLREQCQRIVAAARAFEVLTGSLDDFPEQELDL